MNLSRPVGSPPDEAHRVDRAQGIGGPDPSRPHPPNDKDPEDPLPPPIPPELPH
jgi:hypothetical protein